MITLVKTNSDNPDFINLVKHLDADLAKRDGDDHAFYAQFNKTNKLKHTVVAYENEVAVGCGALREFDPQSMEVKRMYTTPEARGKGVATKILNELETWAAELGYKKTVLETGKRQPEAIELYTKNNYHRISNYGQYADKENSVCFEKELS